MELVELEKFSERRCLKSVIDRVRSDLQKSRVRCVVFGQNPYLSVTGGNDRLWHFDKSALPVDRNRGYFFGSHSIGLEGCYSKLSDILSNSINSVTRILNVIGIAEENIDAFYRIKTNAKRRRVLNRLSDLLEKLVMLSPFNRSASEEIARLMEVRASLTGEAPPDLELTDPVSFRSFHEVLLELSFFLDENKAEFIDTDYLLFESLRDAIDLRINIVDLISDEDSKDIPLEKLVQLENEYKVLRERLRKQKEVLSRLVRDEPVQGSNNT